MKTFQKLVLGAGMLIVTGGWLQAAAETRLDLTGQVIESNGLPIAKATVFIYTAGPKQGTSSLCPSCYADCQKKAKTDEFGFFKIESLDPTLLFRLLVVAEGHESAFVTKVDPTNAAQKITMKPLSAEALKSSLRIKGLVIDEHGKPVPEAVVSPEGVGMGSMTRWGGNDAVVEPLAVADDAGHFVLFCKSNNLDTVYATVDGRVVAKQWATLKPGGDYLLRMMNGVTLTGQVLRDGKPLKGVFLGATTSDRRAGNSFNCDAVATDENGHFLLLNVPPNREFVIYSTMKSLHGNGALPNMTVTTDDSGAVQNLGTLTVQPGYTIAGRVVLSDGKPVPTDIRMFLGREGAMDSQECKLDADGKFEFQGVPTESVSLGVRIKGYQLSKRNPSLDWLNGRILGRVTGDMTNLVILLEPGTWQFNRESDRSDGEDAYPVDKPLRGVKN